MKISELQNLAYGYITFPTLGREPGVSMSGHGKSVRASPDHLRFASKSLRSRGIQFPNRKEGCDDRRSSNSPFFVDFSSKFKDFKLESFTFFEASPPQISSNRPLNCPKLTGNSEKRKRQVSKRLHFSPF